MSNPFYFTVLQWSICSFWLKRAKGAKQGACNPIRFLHKSSNKQTNRHTSAYIELFKRYVMAFNVFIIHSVPFFAIFSFSSTLMIIFFVCCLSVIVYRTAKCFLCHLSLNKCIYLDVEWKRTNKSRDRYVRGGRNGTLDMNVYLGELIITNIPKCSRFDGIPNSIVDCGTDIEWQKRDTSVYMKLMDDTYAKKWVGAERRR